MRNSGLFTIFQRLGPISVSICVNSSIQFNWDTCICRFQFSAQSALDHFRGKIISQKTVSG
jgi:hypothetical protein